MQKLWFSQHQTRVTSLRTRFWRAVATKSCSACASERPGSAPGRQLGVPHGQHGAQDGHHGAQDNPTWRPAAVPSAPRRSRPNPERPKAAWSAPEQHLAEFSSILGSLGPPGMSIFGFSGALFERCCDRWCFAFGISKKSCATQPGILACALCGRFVLRARLSKSPCSIFFRCEHASPPSIKKI